MTEAISEKPLCTTPEFTALIYGNPGVGKSLACASAARWLFKEKGLKSRLILTDAGSYEPYRRGIQEGYIEMMSADGWDQIPPNVLFKLLMEGWWAEDHETPNSRLLPGFEEFRACTKCGGDSGSTGAAQVAKCKGCGENFPAGLRLPLTRRLLHLKGIGMVIVEGLTKIGDMLLTANRESRPGDRFYVAGSLEYQELARRANDLIKSGNTDQALTKEYKAAEAAGFLSLAKGSAQDHWLKADSDLGMIIACSKKLPIPYVLWTAHAGPWEELENRANPNGPKKLRGLGPVIPVMKRNTVLPGWFSMCGHLVRDPKGLRTLVMEEHFGPESQTVPWAGKINVPGVPTKLVLEDPMKVNNFAKLMAEVEKARRVEVP